MNVVVIGAGWNGCHCALTLAKAGHQVVLLEKADEVFRGVSGDFGIRLHKGPHYPRSKATRKNCLAAFDRFCEEYPDLVVAHESAIYAQGRTDALGNRSKVSAQEFADVCHESPECRALDFRALGFNELESAFHLDEPSAVLGERLRIYFKQKLIDAGVQVHLGVNVESIRTRHDGLKVIHASDGRSMVADRVINSTGFQSLLPERFKEDFPFDVEVVYQPCLALCYKDQAPAQKPLSFIVMDGWFPCLMPAITSDALVCDDYILTHGSYTIMGSFAEPDQAHALLATLCDAFIEANIKPATETQMLRFWPQFLQRFRYTGWKGAVLAKLKTRSEFRSAVTFERDGVIYIFPGKISNAFDAADEVLTLLGDQGCVEQNGFRFAMDGVLFAAWQELEEKPQPWEQNTCNLHTYQRMSVQVSEQ